MAPLARPDYVTDLAPHLVEYEKLKEEQGQRIHFRDNMRYVMLVAAGFVFAKASDMPFALLAIPWICLVLGWTYVANSRRVSSIRVYLKKTLADKVGTGYFEWEKEHQNDRARRILVDEITFVGPGLVALIAFPIGIGADVRPGWLVGLGWLLVAVEVPFLGWLGWEIGHPRESERLTRAVVKEFLKRLGLERRQPGTAASVGAFDADQHRVVAVGSA
jgi:hypothetical protein